MTQFRPQSQVQGRRSVESGHPNRAGGWTRDGPGSPVDNGMPRSPPTRRVRSEGFPGPLPAPVRRITRGRGSSAGHGAGHDGDPRWYGGADSTMSNTRGDLLASVCREITLAVFAGRVIHPTTGWGAVAFAQADVRLGEENPGSGAGADGRTGPAGPPDQHPRHTTPSRPHTRARRTLRACMPRRHSAFGPRHFRRFRACGHRRLHSRARRGLRGCGPRDFRPFGPRRLHSGGAGAHLRA